MIENTSYRFQLNVHCTKWVNPGYNIRWFYKPGSMAPVELRGSTYEVVWPNLWSCVSQPMKLCDPTYEVVWPNLWSCVSQPMKLGLNGNKSNRLTKLSQFALDIFFTNKTLFFLVWCVMVVFYWPARFQKINFSMFNFWFFINLKCKYAFSLVCLSKQWSHTVKIYTYIISPYHY